jgi:chromosome segregation ATPase
MSFSGLRDDKNGLIQANRDLRKRLRRLAPSDREGRHDIYQTLDRNNQRIAEINAEMASGKAAKAENRQRLTSLFEQKGGLIEANRQLRQQIRDLPRDHYEWRKDLNNTIRRNDLEIAQIDAEISEIRAS